MLPIPEKLLQQHVNATDLKQINQWISKYPPDQKQSAVMGALMIIQKAHGYLTTTVMDALATYLEMPAIAVYEVATFYRMYQLKPVGRHTINICTNISCQLRNCDALVAYLEKTLAIKLGETTADGRFTLRAVECLGACVNAPMLQIDQNYHENLTLTNIDQVLQQYQ